LSPEQRVRKDHPLRAVRAMTDEIPEQMSPLFEAMYAQGGRPSIPPEKLLRAQLLQMLYSVRSERLLVEEIDYSILYRWFVGPDFGRSSVGRDHLNEESRLAAGSGSDQGLLAQVGAYGGLISDEHFTVDGTLLNAGRA
jgi:transposase